MRCELCNKIVGVRHAYDTHLKLSHKELSLQERIDAINRAFPQMNPMMKRYGEIKDRIRRGELVSKEEFAIVKARDQRHNRLKRVYFT